MGKGHAENSFEVVVKDTAEAVADPVRSQGLYHFTSMVVDVHVKVPPIG